MTDTTVEPPLHQQLSRIDEPMERRRVGDMQVSKWAGLTFSEYREAIEFSKLMAQAKHSVPNYLKGNPGDCLAIVTQSLRWRLEPYWVAQHSYIAKAESLIAYDSAVHAAIVLSSGMINGRPLYSWAGEGEERTCTVVCVVGNQKLDYTTPPLRQCRPPRNEQGVVKGSPIWVKDPDQQLGYFAIRNWGRRHAPELLGGVYDPEEFEETTQDETDVVPPSPRLMDRLPGKVAEISGYQPDVVDAGLAVKVEKAKAEAKAAEKPQDAPAPALQADPAPQAEKPPPDLPQDAGAYMAWAAKWIEVVADEEELKSRWASEADMRANLKVPLAIRKRLEAMLHAQIAALKQGRRR